MRSIKIKNKDYPKINLIFYLLFLLANFLLISELTPSTKNISKFEDKPRYSEKKKY